MRSCHQRRRLHGARDQDAGESGVAHWRGAGRRAGPRAERCQPFAHAPLPTSRQPCRRRRVHGLGHADGLRHARDRGAAPGTPRHRALGRQSRREPGRRRPLLGDRGRGHGGDDAGHPPAFSYAGRDPEGSPRGGRAVRLLEQSSAARTSRPIPCSTSTPPIGPDRVAGVRITTLGRRAYVESLTRAEDPGGREYYWIGAARAAVGRPDSTSAVHSGYVVTPLHMISPITSSGGSRGGT